MVATPGTNIQEIARRANELLKDIGSTRHARLKKEGQLRERVQVLQNRYGPGIEELKQHEESLVKQLVDLVLPNFERLAFRKTKTIKFRNGEVSLGPKRQSVELSDTESRIIRRIAQQAVCAHTPA